MLPVTQTKRTPKRRGRFANIVADSAALGCSRVTLWKVLSGRRPDLVGLRRRYEELQRRQRRKP
jgi:hypothetical protein